MGVSKGQSALLAAIGASVVVYGTYVALGLNTPLPGEDQEVSDGLAVEKHEFVTSDGARIRAKRYANPGGNPVVLCHGLGCGGYAFDLPREGRNLGAYLAGRGFDVWIPSFRGCGHAPYWSECADWRFSADHLGIYDVPSIVEGVAGATGKKPFYVGHSLGGTALYMYLQGTRFSDDGLVVSDQDLSRERNSLIAGGITLGSPAAAVLRGPASFINETITGRALLRLACLLVRLREKASPRSGVASAADRLLGGHPRLLMAMSRSPVYALIYSRKNTDKDTTTSFFKWAMNDVPIRMYVQLLDALREVEIRQYRPLKYQYGPYNYTENMDLITTPMLFVSGSEDFADKAGIKLYGFGCVGSAFREFVEIPGYGHTDLLIGAHAKEDVFSLLADWIHDTGERINAAGDSTRSG